MTFNVLVESTTPVVCAILLCECCFALDTYFSYIISGRFEKKITSERVKKNGTEIINAAIRKCGNDREPETQN